MHRFEYLWADGNKYKSPIKGMSLRHVTGISPSVAAWGSTVSEEYRNAVPSVRWALDGTDGMSKLYTSEPVLPLRQHCYSAVFHLILHL